MQHRIEQQQKPKTTIGKGQCFLRSSSLMFSVFLFAKNKIKTPLKTPTTYLILKERLIFSILTFPLLFPADVIIRC